MSFPEGILAEHVFPYVDRVTLNRATVTCKNALAVESDRMKQGNTTLPWPTGCYVSSDGYKICNDKKSDQHICDILSEDAAGLIRQRVPSNSVARTSLKGAGESVSFSSDGSILSVSSSQSGKIFIYNVRRGLVQIISEEGVAQIPYHKIAFAKACLNGTDVRHDNIIEGPTTTEALVLTRYNGSGLTRFYNYGNRSDAIVTKEEDNHAEFGSIRPGKFEHHGQNEATLFVPKGTIYHGNYDRLKRTSSFCISLDTQILVSANWMDLETYFVWNMKSEQNSKDLPPHEPRMFQARSVRRISANDNIGGDNIDCVISAIGISSDTSMIASGGSDGSLCLSHTENGEHIATLSPACPPWKVRGDVLFSPNGRHVATIHHWEYEARLSQKVRIWSDDFKVFPHGRILSMSTSNEDTAKASQQRHRTRFASFLEKVLQHKNTEITCLCFSPNSEYLVGGCAHTDYSLLVWSVASGFLVRIIKGPGIVHDLDVSSKAGAVVAGCHNGTFCLWTFQEVFPPSNSTSLKPDQSDEDNETPIEECRYF